MPALPRQRNCEPCRRSKRRCDLQRPACGRCRERRLDCSYVGAAVEGGNGGAGTGAAWVHYGSHPARSGGSPGVHHRGSSEREDEVGRAEGAGGVGYAFPGHLEERPGWDRGYGGVVDGDRGYADRYAREAEGYRDGGVGGVWEGEGHPRLAIDPSLESSLDPSLDPSLQESHVHTRASHNGNGYAAATNTAPVFALDPALEMLDPALEILDQSAEEVVKPSVESNGHREEQVPPHRLKDDGAKGSLKRARPEDEGGGDRGTKEDIQIREQSERAPSLDSDTIRVAP
ncbi:Hypothetical protein D9617_23g005790 [Elsinoe fawcettii]|nr:Hypothetical protein D9617_23g005790 [Elsinoe fawcettii]